MQIKMLTRSAGPNGNRTIGQVLDVGDAEGRELIAGGYAESVSVPQSDTTALEEEPAETATLAVEAETAVKTPQKKRK